MVEELLAAAAEGEPQGELRELAWAIERIEQSAGAVEVGALARELGWSERRLQRASYEQIGVPPKLFARLVRFDTLMARVRSGTGESWARAAFALGYSDQSHLVRDVRQFAGVHPTTAEEHLLPVSTAEAS